MRHYAEQMKPGRQYRFTMKEKRPRRTTGEKSQNHHLNGHVQQIAMETGAGFDDIKSYIKREAVAMGYPFVTLANGDILPKSEADSDTAECALLIESAHVVAADNGIILRED